MGYIGVQPKAGFTSGLLDRFTSTTGTTVTLTHDIASENDIIVFVNFVKQDSTNYSVGGTGNKTLTLGGTLVSSDVVEVHYINAVKLTQAPSDNSVSSDKLTGNLVTPGTLDVNGQELILDADADTSITADTDDQIDLKVGGTDTMHIVNGKVGITSVPDLGAGLHIKTSDTGGSVNGNGDELVIEANGNAGLSILTGNSNTASIFFADSDDQNIGAIQYDHSSSAATMLFRVTDYTRLKINSDGKTLVGGQDSFTTSNLQVRKGGEPPLTLDRSDSDGKLVQFHQATIEEGNISVSGSTVSYNGFTGTHWSRLSDSSKPTILRGTILESLDEMCDWYAVEFETHDGIITQPYSLGSNSVGDTLTYKFNGKDYTAKIIKENDVKHAKCKISDTEASKAVYGLFVSWDEDEDTVNDMLVAQTGTYVIRIHKDETISKGDLIQSKGDGTGKVQADDIMRASTVAKVLSTTKIETYSDGSYIVPCSLHC